MENLSFRYAEEKDVPRILFFIREPAAYENMSDQVVATEELLKEWVFEKKKAEVLFAVLNGEEIGFALFFHHFSTFPSPMALGFMRFSSSFQPLCFFDCTIFTFHMCEYGGPFGTVPNGPTLRA